MKVVGSRAAGGDHRLSRADTREPLAMRFKDHFSRHAADYARYRPTYPRELFEFLADAAPGRALAWDCATGSGQAAVALAGFFDRVIATDASARQLESAGPHPRVTYRLEPAETSTLGDSSCDLVTVAQALHWFGFDAFYREVRRVSRSGALLAAWAYERMRVTPGVDEILDELLDVTLVSYWPPERAFVETGYASLPFPFARITEPDLAMEVEWTVEQCVSYLRTWSAVQRFQAEHGFDPIEEISRRVAIPWCAGTRPVRWPLILRFGIVD